MRADRLLQMILTLQASGPTTASRLAEELEVSVRTVYRDVVALSAAGVPVTTESGPGGGIGLLDGYQTRLTGLSASEAAALALAGAPDAARQLGLGPGLVLAQRKLDAALPADAREGTARLRDRVLIDAPGWFREAEDAPALAELSRAVLEDRRADLRYRRSGHVVRRTVGPLGLVVKAGTWYLVATAGRTHQLRMFRVSRVASVRLRPEPVDRPAGFDLRGAWTSLSRSFDHDIRRYRVLLRLPAERLGWLRHVLTPDGAAEAIASAGPLDADGWCEVEVRSESEAVAHDELLRLGASFEVVAPAALRRALQRTGAALAARHAP